MRNNLTVKAMGTEVDTSRGGLSCCLRAVGGKTPSLVGLERTFRENQPLGSFDFLVVFLRDGGCTRGYGGIVLTSKTAWEKPHPASTTGQPQLQLVNRRGCAIAR